jgi:hypothetical protein
MSENVQISAGVILTEHNPEPCETQYCPDDEVLVPKTFNAGLSDLDDTVGPDPT